MKLRPYQKETIDKILDAMKDGHKKIGVTSPTGTGKTMIIKELIRDLDLRVIFVAPQTNLVEQTVESFSDLGKIELIRGRSYNRSARLYVTTWQTLRNRTDLGKIDLIVFDEFHIGSRGKSFATIINNNPEATIIGLSATMFDADGKPFEDMFDIMIDTHPITWFIDHGYLTPIKIYSPVRPDLSKVRTNIGDYNIGDLDILMSQSVIMSNIVGKTIDYVKGKHTFTYAVTIKHADMLAEAYREAGIKAESYHSNSEDRPQLLQDFKDGKIDMLCSVSSLIAGVDAPFVDCLVIARPTKSHSLFRQIVGRGMRLYEGKEYCHILDCGNIVNTLGNPLDKPKPRENVAKYNQLFCHHCSGHFLKLLSSKVNEELMEVVKTYECLTCHQTFHRVVESKATTCEECDAMISKPQTRIVETDEVFQFISECSECGHEKVFRSLEKFDAELKEIPLRTISRSLDSVIQKLAFRVDKNMPDDEYMNIIKKLDKIKSMKMSSFKQDLVERLVDLDIIGMSSFRLAILQESIEHYDMQLFELDELKEIFFSTNSSDILIITANEIYRQVRPGYQTNDNRLRETVTVFTGVSLIDKESTCDLLRETISMIFEKGHRFSSLIHHATTIRAKIVRQKHFN